MKPNKIPIVDLTPWLSEVYPAEVDISIEHALDNYGFIELVGHGISESLVSSIVCELENYFGRSCHQKLKDKVHPSNYRGYIPLGYFSPNNGTGENDCYEGYKLHFEVSGENKICEESSLYGPNKWPHKTGNLRRLITSYWDQCDQLAMRFLGALGWPQ